MASHFRCLMRAIGSREHSAQETTEDLIARAESLNMQHKQWSEGLLFTSSLREICLRGEILPVPLPFVRGLGEKSLCCTYKLCALHYKLNPSQYEPFQQLTCPVSTKRTCRLDRRRRLSSADRHVTVVAPQRSMELHSICMFCMQARICKSGVFERLCLHLSLRQLFVRSVITLHHRSPWRRQNTLLQQLCQMARLRFRVRVRPPKKCGQAVYRPLQSAMSFAEILNIFRPRQAAGLLMSQPRDESV